MAEAMGVTFCRTPGALVEQKLDVLLISVSILSFEKVVTKTLEQVRHCMCGVRVGVCVSVLVLCVSVNHSNCVSFLPPFFLPSSPLLPLFQVDVSSTLIVDVR
jgi:hypothetical protein